VKRHDHFPFRFQAQEGGCRGLVHWSIPGEQDVAVGRSPGDGHRTSKSQNRRHVRTNAQQLPLPVRRSDGELGGSRVRLADEGNPLHVQAVAGGLESQLLDASSKEGGRTLRVAGARLAAMKRIVGNYEQVASELGGTDGGPRIGARPLLGH
jgi:hypothetical protein